VGAWDYGPASGEALADVPTPEQGAAKTEKTRTTVMWLAAGLFAAGMVYKFSGTTGASNQEQEMYGRIAEKADRARRAQRVRELLAAGHDEPGATAIAAQEHWDATLGPGDKTHEHHEPEPTHG
jgi:hypothetical protein